MRYVISVNTSRELAWKVVGSASTFEDAWELAKKASGELIDNSAYVQVKCERIYK